MKFRINIFILIFCLILGVITLSPSAFADYTSDFEQQEFLDTVASWSLPESEKCSRYIMVPDFHYHFDTEGNLLGRGITSIFLFLMSDNVYTSFVSFPVNDKIWEKQCLLFPDGGGYYCKFQVYYSDFQEGNATSWLNTNTSCTWDKHYDFVNTSGLKVYSSGYYGAILGDYGVTYYNGSSYKPYPGNPVSVTYNDIISTDLTFYNEDGSVAYSPYEVYIYQPSTGQVIYNENKDDIKLIFKAKGCDKVRIGINGTWFPEDLNSYIDLSVFEYDSANGLYSIYLKDFEAMYNVSLLKENSINHVSVSGYINDDEISVGYDVSRFEIRNDPFKSYINILEPSKLKYNNSANPDIVIESNLVPYFAIYLNNSSLPVKYGDNIEKTEYEDGRIINIIKGVSVPYLKNAVNEIVIKGYETLEDLQEDRNCICFVSKDIIFTSDVSDDDIYLPPDVIDDWNRPEKPPAGSSATDWLVYYVKEVIYLLSFPFRIIGQVINAIINVLNQAFGYVSQLVGIFSNFISFMPKEWVFLITLGLTLGLVLRLFGR